MRILLQQASLIRTTAEFCQPNLLRQGGKNVLTPEPKLQLDHDRSSQSKRCQELGRFQSCLPSRRSADELFGNHQHVARLHFGVQNAAIKEISGAAEIYHRPVGANDVNTVNTLLNPSCMPARLVLQPVLDTIPQFYPAYT